MVLSILANVFISVYSRANLLRPSNTLFREWATVSTHAHISFVFKGWKHQITNWYLYKPAGWTFDTNKTCLLFGMTCLWWRCVAFPVETRVRTSVFTEVLYELVAELLVATLLLGFGLQPAEHRHVSARSHLEPLDGGSYGFLFALCSMGPPQAWVGEVWVNWLSWHSRIRPFWPVHFFSLLI